MVKQRRDMVCDSPRASDLVLDRANALLTLAEALDARDGRGAATDARGQAVTLLRDKDHTGAIAHLVG